MRVLPFPDDRDAGGLELTPTELDAALSGIGDPPSARYWRALRDDVRALSPTLDPDFAAALGERLRAQAAPRRPAHGETASASGRLRRRRTSRSMPASSRRRMPRPAPTLGMLAVLCLLVPVAIVIGTSGGGSAGHGAGTAAPSAGARSAPAVRAQSGPLVAAPAPSAPAEASSGASAGSFAGTGNSPSAGDSGDGRVQELGASLTLGTPAAQVQEASDRVAHVVEADGGYVQSSQVQVQAHGVSEGQLSLRVPSAKLNAALAALARIAPVRAESQTLQDITGAYESAHRRLSDAVALRAALVRALAHAETQGQIESLRQRLAEARNAVSQATAEVQSVSHRAQTSAVEVTVLGTAPSTTSGDLSLHRGLHDASHVLVVALVVLLIAGAVLVPLALVLALLVSAARIWQRHARERVLSRG